MGKQKLAPAKSWRGRSVDDWNTLTFTEYLRDKHIEQFGVDYAPMRSWRLEQGLIGDLIGTRAKPRKASNAMVRRFIDECFATYTPNAQYPGTSFGFSWAYRKNVWQRLQAEEAQQAKATQAIEEQPDLDELSDWL